MFTKAICLLVLIGSAFAVEVPDGIAFGEIAKGESVSKTIAVTNENDSAIHFKEFDVSGKGNFQQFVVDGGTCKDGLEAHETCTLTIKFIGRLVGPAKDTLTITTLTGSLAKPQLKMNWVALEGSVK